MSWQQLLATRRVQPHTPQAQELRGLRAVVARDLKDAALPLDCPTLSRVHAITENSPALQSFSCTGHRCVLALYREEAHTAGRQEHASTEMMLVLPR
jgi:hypothetical protein